MIAEQGITDGIDAKIELENGAEIILRYWENPRYGGRKTVLEQIYDPDGRMVWECHIPTNTAQPYDMLPGLSGYYNEIVSYLDADEDSALAKHNGVDMVTE